MKDLKNEKQREAMALREYLLSLPLRESRVMVKRLAEECKVPDYTIRNWRYGNARIPELYKAKIEEIVGQPIFSPQYIHEL